MAWFTRPFEAVTEAEDAIKASLSSLQTHLFSEAKKVGDLVKWVSELAKKVATLIVSVAGLKTIVFNVKDYGAKMDGSDDYIPLIAALNAASAAGGGIVLIPGGVLKYGTKITLNVTVKDYNGITIQGMGIFATTLWYTGTDDGFSLGGNLNGFNVTSLRLYTTTGRDGFSFMDGVASATPDGGVMRWRDMDIRGWGRHGIKARLTIEWILEGVFSLLNGGCGLYIENANPYRATTLTVLGGAFIQNGGHGIVLKGTFTQYFAGVATDSNTGLSFDVDTLSCASYTAFVAPSVAFSSTDIGKPIVINGSTVGTLAHYGTNGDCVINATAAVPVALVGGFTPFAPSDIGKDVLVNAVNVGPLVSYTAGGEFVVRSITRIVGGQSFSVVSGTGAGTIASTAFTITGGSGAGTVGATRKNSIGLYAARSGYLHINGGHAENHIYGFFLDSVYSSNIANGYYLTQGNLAWGLYLAGSCTAVEVPVVGADVQAGGAGAMYIGPLCIGTKYTQSSAYTTRDESSNSFCVNTQNAGPTLVFLRSTGTNPFTSETSAREVGYFSGTHATDAEFSVNTSGGSASRAKFSLRKDGSRLLSMFVDNVINACGFLVGSNVLSIFDAGTANSPDVVQVNTAGKMYLVGQGQSGPFVLEGSSSVADATGIAMAEYSGSAPLNNGEKCIARIKQITVGAVANERGGKHVFSTRTSGASGAEVDRASLDEAGLTLLSLAGTGPRLVQSDTVGLLSATISAAKIPQVLTTNTTAVGSVLTGEDDLMTYSVPAATLAADGDSINVTAAGRFALATVRLRAYFGSDLLFDTGSLVLGAAADWGLECDIIRTGAATQKAVVRLNTSFASFAAYCDYTTPGRTLSGANTFKLTGEATLTNDIVQEMMKVRFEPA